MHVDANKNAKQIDSFGGPIVPSPIPAYAPRYRGISRRVRWSCATPMNRPDDVPLHAVIVTGKFEASTTRLREMPLAIVVRSASESLKSSGDRRHEKAGKIPGEISPLSIVL